MRLPAALGDSTADAPEKGAAFPKVLDIAESPGDPEYQLRADTVRHCNVPKSSMISRRVGRVRAIGCSASA
jgi:hypothetical protein